MSITCSQCKQQGGILQCLDPKTCPKFAIVVEEKAMTAADFASLFGEAPKTRATSGHVNQDTGWDTLWGTL